MEAATATGAGRKPPVPPARPGWWTIAGVFVLGYIAAFVPWVVAIAALDSSTGLFSGANGTDLDPPFLIVGPVSAVAAAGLFAFTLTFVAVPISWAADRWLVPAPRPTWVLAALGVGGFGAFFEGLLGAGGFVGLLAAVVILRYGAYDRRGAARPGLLDVVPPGHRRSVRWAVLAVPIVGLLAAAAYQVAHPAQATQWPQRSGTLGSGETWAVARPHRYAEPPVVVTDLPVRAAGRGAVTLLGVRVAGAAAAHTRVVRVGWGGEQERRRIPPTVTPTSLVSGGLEVWLAAPRCPAPALSLDRLDVRVRNWTGTRWVPLRTPEPLRVACVARDR